MIVTRSYFSTFFFNDTATTEIYTLSLHDALPISRCRWRGAPEAVRDAARRRSLAAALRTGGLRHAAGDRKSTRLNSSHVEISYAVFCLKKKTKAKNTQVNKTSPPPVPSPNSQSTV